MADKNALTQKIKVLGKLYAAGCVTEKQLQDLKIEDILGIPGITVPEMKEITEIQKQVKNRSLFSYLGGGYDEHSESD
ncbi:MAG: hypothetical protein EOM05_04830 [Clostridia bacterium]|nr:hypothetical protein [Clostridia bacterium]